MNFPNYATKSNKDRWIDIQDYQHENWYNLVQLWKYSNLHMFYVNRHLDMTKLSNHWISSEIKHILLHEMIEYNPQLFDLHLKEIEELINL
jgi:hypothetical protein